MATGADLKWLLSHVLWIGGPPDAGKTSVAGVLSSKYHLRWYNFDYFEPAHIARMSPERHPTLHAFIGMTVDQRWVMRSPQIMAQETIHFWTERFGLALEDLLSWPREEPILAEGPGFFPECLAPLLSTPRQAIWLLPSAAFKRASVARRDKLGGVQTSDPARARRNLIDRDLLIGRHVEQRARELGLTLYEVDGARDVTEVAALVEAHFAPRLPRLGERPGTSGVSPA